MTERVVDVSSRPAGTPLPAVAVRPLPLTNAIGSVTRMGLGAVGMVVSTFSEATARLAPTDRTSTGAGPTPVPSAGILRLLPGALLGAGFEAERRILNASAAVETRLI